MIKLTKGDLLKADVEALVNTVNTEGFMGKGIALQFKRAFPDNYEKYAAACKQGRVKTGEMFVTPVRRLDSGVKYIINFPTKEKWRAKSKLEYIRSGLQALLQEVAGRGIKSIAVPPLGCGLGGLPWATVKKLIEEAFEQCPEVEVLLFAPGETPAAGAMINNSPAPRFTGLWAALFKTLDRYMACSFSTELSQVEIQKLAYFLHLAGFPLPLKFTRGVYGPYCDTLRHIISQHEGHSLHGFGDGTAPVLASNIELLIDRDQINRLLESTPEMAQVVNRALAYIKGFESAYGLELLGSVHWAAAHEVAPELTAVTAFVQGWTKRKGDMFTDEHISIAFEHLRKNGLID